MSSLVTRNLKIQYRTTGKGKIPIVFIHGNYASSRWWLPQLERLSEEFHGFAPDLRGCGTKNGITHQLQKVEGPLRIRDLSDDLSEFISSLNLKSPFLVGHSLGGVIATDYAVRNPGAIRGLLLVDTGPPNGLPGGSLAYSVLVPLEFGSEFLMRNALRLTGIPRRGEFAKALVQDALAASPGQYLEFSRAVSKWNIEGQLSTLDIPVTLIWGRKDRIMPPNIGQLYLHRIPQAEMLLVPDAGHSPHLERPDVFARVLEKFVEKSVPSRGSRYDEIPPRKFLDSLAHWIRLK